MVALTHAVVAAPAHPGFGCIAHLLQGLGSEVAQLPQAAVMEHPGADPAGVEVIGRPHLAHVAHLFAWRLRRKKVRRKLRVKNMLGCAKGSEIPGRDQEAGFSSRAASSGSFLQQSPNQSSAF